MPIVLQLAILEIGRYGGESFDFQIFVTLLEMFGTVIGLTPLDQQYSGVNHKCP